MNKIHKNNKGFSTVELVLAVVIVILIGAVGYLVYKNNHKTTTANVAVTTDKSPAAIPSTTNKTPTPTLPTGTISTTDITGTYSYPGNIFTLLYPASWTEDAQTVPVATVQPGIQGTVVTISPPNTPEGETAGITAYKSTSLSNALSEDSVGQSAKIKDSKSLTINGYNALYEQVVTNSTKTTDSYAVTNNSYTIVFDFVLNGGGDPSASSSFDATSLLPEFNAIVSSIKF